MFIISGAPLPTNPLPLRCIYVMSPEVSFFEVDQRNDHLVGAFLSGRTDKPHGGESFGLAVQAGEVFLQTLGVICQDTFYHFLTFYH